MPDILQFAMGMLQRNPKVANNPQFQNYISVIQSGDSAKGAEIARNICASYGKTPEEASAEARRFFGI